MDDLDELSGKMYELEKFVVRLREHPDNQSNMVLAAAVERLLQIGSSDQISQAFTMCEEKFKEV